MEEKDTPKGFVELNIPVAIIGNCHTLHHGQRVQLSGSTQQMGGNNVDDVKIYAERRGDWLSFGIYAGHTGAMFQDKLRDTWKCDIVSIELVPPPETKSPSKPPEPPNHSRQPGKRKKSDTPPRNMKTRSASKKPTVKDADTKIPVQRIKMEPCGLFDPTEVSEDDPSMVADMSTQDVSTVTSTEIETSQATTNAKSGISEQSENIDAGNCEDEDDPAADYSSHEDSDYEQENEETINEGDVKMETVATTSLQTTPNGRKKYDRSKYKEGPRKKRRKTTEAIGELVCEFCTRNWFLSYKSYHRHLNSCQQNPENRTHEETEEEKAIRIKYTCHVCNMACGKNRLKRHLEIAHKIRVKKAKAREPNSDNRCSFCKEAFSSSAGLYRHKTFRCIENPNVRIGKQRSCHYCGTEFDIKNLQRHINKMHPNGYSGMCDICGRSFDNKRQLFAHRRSHLKTTSKKLRCEVCDKQFAFKNAYVDHLTVHSDERPEICEQCGKRFKTRGCLQKHVHAIHKNKYTYHCKICGHGMQKKKYLEAHRCGRVRRKQDDDTDFDGGLMEEHYIPEEPVMYVNDTKVVVIKPEMQQEQTVAVDQLLTEQEGST